MKKAITALALAATLLLSMAFAELPDNYVVRHGSRDEKKIAITVDDCWKYEYVVKIHELSVELDFPITWFPAGVCLRDGEEAIWHEIIAHGSEIGNHSWKHPNLLDYGIANVYTNVGEPQEHIDHYLGYHYPLRLYRPPGGNYKNESRNCLPIFLEFGVEKVVLWDVDVTDAQKAFKQTQNGSILLYHTNKIDYECLQVLVPMLKEAGFELVTITDLLGLEPLEFSDELYVYPPLSK